MYTHPVSANFPISWRYHNCIPLSSKYSESIFIEINCICFLSGFLGWTKKFGNVYQFKLGVNTSVVLGDRESIQEAFVKNSPDVDSRCQWRKCFNETFKGLYFDFIGLHIINLAHNFRFWLTLDLVLVEITSDL